MFSVDRQRLKALQSCVYPLTDVTPSTCTEHLSAGGTVFSRGQEILGWHSTHLGCDQFDFVMVIHRTAMNR